ncbi:MAG: hypothetical protein EOP84_09150 [Verrucomicrobiaceae bacterium]|nr:MAG: hypothetical protein EOP84_09150 [Verrucomicrobiaceae bacterium]
MVFDDAFVAENVHSGMDVEPAHRQRLHDLIVGAEGVTLSRSLNSEIGSVEQHIKALKEKGDAIPKQLRGDLTAEKFCMLAPIRDCAARIDTVAKALAAARDAEGVAKRAPMPELRLPGLDLTVVRELLLKSLTTLEVTALGRVQQHIRGLGAGGEGWVEDGNVRGNANASGLCPYCAQPLTGSHLISHYQTYFSGAYRDLKLEIGQLGKNIAETHLGDAVAAFERHVREAVQAAEFWSKFTDVPKVEIDTASIVREWHSAVEPILSALRLKYISPLEAITLDADTCNAVAAYHRQVERISELMEIFEETNRRIDLVRERAASANLGALERDLATLNVVESRYSAHGIQLADRWLAERNAKNETEKRRDEARAALERYREEVFPAYETHINDYLRRLNAGFRLQKVSSQNIRSGSSASYHVLVNQTAVPVSGAAPNSPSFKTVLSSGDRNSLALALFFSSVELDPAKETRIVVFDDPMTSLDEHRTLATVREILELRHRVAQVIVLSHSKPFLFAVWEDTRKNDPRSALKVERHLNDTSTLTLWDVTKEAATAHDQRSALVQAYLVSPQGLDERQVAAALRPMLEAFVRVAYPEWCPAGTLLGKFIDRAERALGTSDQRLSKYDVAELSSLKDYGNLFHHNTNPSFQTQAINDAQLVDFARRTIAFTRRQH